MLGFCDNRDFVEKIDVDVICGYFTRFEIEKKNIPEIQVFQAESASKSVVFTN